MSTRRNPSPLNLLRPVRRLVDAFFRHDVGLKRGSEGLQVVLQPQAPKPVKALTREQEAARRDKAELALMLKQLAELLDELPETRQTMRHLVFVEHAITKHRLKALHKLPVDVLEKALSQLEGLVTNWSPVGLASLRSKMAVAIIDREHRVTEGEAYNTAQAMDSTPPPEATSAPAAADAASEDDALAAAYAALGHLAPMAMELPASAAPAADDGPGKVELQGQLGSRTPRPIERDLSGPMPLGPPEDSIRIRTLQS